MSRVPRALLLEGVQSVSPSMLLSCPSLPLSEGQVVGYRGTDGIEEKFNRVFKARADQSIGLDSGSSSPPRSPVTAKLFHFVEPQFIHTENRVWILNLQRY